ncbi:hypothetical protein [Conchiformibius steedae]|uniref:Uncharacterized protein n=1 Tax=Conchiformibius steedae TaxID=153493 RepID=A0A3P2A9U6_9NEIS|nr:hypothetical protein [Conchiformibius steedae]RRD91546.1 hypothetical protein EII21_00505 [Conchiformibius steedae]
MNQTHSPNRLQLKRALIVWSVISILVAVCIWGSDTLIALCVGLYALLALIFVLYRISTGHYRLLKTSERDALAGSGADWLGMVAIELLLSCVGMTVLIVMVGGLGAILMLIPVWVYIYYRWRKRKT